MDTARAQWELENDVEAASESDEASLFRYDEAQQKKIQEEKPWKQNPNYFCLLYTSPSPRDLSTSRMPSSA